MFSTLEIFQINISGRETNEVHPIDIAVISLTFNFGSFLFIDIFGRDFKESHVANIELISITHL